MMTATLVLVHGAWHGGWCWEQVPAPTLPAPTLPFATSCTSPRSRSTPTESIITNDFAGGEHAELASAIEFHADPTLTVDPARAGEIFYADREPALVPGFVTRLVPEGAAGFDQQPRAVA